MKKILSFILRLFRFIKPIAFPDPFITPKITCIGHGDLIAKEGALWCQGYWKVVQDTKSVRRYWTDGVSVPRGWTDVTHEHDDLW